MKAADARILHLFANYKWTGPADPAIRAAARLRDLGLDVCSRRVPSCIAAASTVSPRNWRGSGCRW